MICTLDGDRAKLAGDIWSETFPISELPEKLELYRWLRDRRDRQFAGIYAGTVAAIEQAMREAGMRVPPENTSTKRRPRR